MLDDGVQLLDHDEPVHGVREFLNELIGERPGHGELEDGCVWEDLPGVLPGDPVGDYSHLLALPLDLVELVGELLELLVALLHPLVLGPRVGGHHHVLARGLHVVDKGSFVLLVPPSHLHYSGGMGHPGGDAVKHGSVEPLGDIEGHFQQVLGLLAV